MPLRVPTQQPAPNSDGVAADSAAGPVRYYEIRAGHEVERCHPSRPAVATAYDDAQGSSPPNVCNLPSDP